MSDDRLVNIPVPVCVVLVVILIPEIKSQYVVIGEAFVLEFSRYSELGSCSKRVQLHHRKYLRCFRLVTCSCQSKILALA